MATMVRKVLLAYDGQNYFFHQLTSSDKQALVFSIRDLEKKLDKMPGSLKRHFADKENWEIRLL